MLVLSRKSGESLRIGDEIRLVIVRIDRDRVRLGIERRGCCALPAANSTCCLPGPRVTSNRRPRRTRARPVRSGMRIFVVVRRDGVASKGRRATMGGGSISPQG